MKRLVIALSIMASSASYATVNSDSIFGYSVEQDIVYGQGAVRPEGEHGEIEMRDLLMDVYHPANIESDEPLPVVVYVHGGGHHRGDKFMPGFRVGDAIHTAPQEYGRMFAAEGYVTFVPEYRLATEWPETDHMPGEANLHADLDLYVDDVMLAGVSRARTSLGLSTPEGQEGKLTLWKGGMSGAEDVVKTINHIIENAEQYNIDPERIAIGGHSAGGGIAANVAFGFKAPVVAAFPMSAPEIAFDASVMDSDIPPTLLTYSQFDDHAMLVHAPRMVKLLERSGVDFSVNWVPGFMHSYPGNAISLASDGTRMPLFDRIVAFLDENVKNAK
ncbi:alpha/beta hydrolase [Thaumasiovibrio sp. DFM-14]|uniref:alpha/beta hydrolase n=1 Tax=Thaumasiovibrio sp. DFM-14 TaxID=3384792 RepID=UPI0039A1D8FC